MRRRGMLPIVPLLLCTLSGISLAQKAGRKKKEEHPRIAFSTCRKSGGCTQEEMKLTLDAQWRWLHNDELGHCIQKNKWVVDRDTCASTCELEGVSRKDYEIRYGVQEVEGGVRMKYVNGQGAVGSRLYLMDGDRPAYKVFKLLNKEFSFDVDAGHLGCGLNGALYFVEMQADGGMGIGDNKAGAKFGTGYCDAQCPHDLKFVDGECNIQGWHMTPRGPFGHYGSCCSELDIWEANAHASAFTAHPCETLGPLRCPGFNNPNFCGDTSPHCPCCHDLASCSCCGRYKGVCDKDGCDYNSYRLGNTSFLGKGPGFVLDTERPMTVVTQFLTSDGTEAGALKEIRRLYVQDGKVIKNSAVANFGDSAMDSMSDEFCTAQKTAFNNPDDFNRKGGMRAMGEAMRRGMVLVLSLWDDEKTRMSWLDSAIPKSLPASTRGVKRGPCGVSAGRPSELRAKSPDATVTYANIRVGDIGSTIAAATASTPSFGRRRSSSPAPAPPVALEVTVAEEQPVLEAPAKSNMSAEANATVDGFAPVCCSSALGPDKCSSCWRGSIMDHGYCASEENCKACGGQWCATGVIFAEAFEQPATAAARAPVDAPSSLPLGIPVVAAFGGLASLGVAALAVVRMGKGQAISAREEQRSLCVESTLEDNVISA